MRLHGTICPLCGWKRLDPPKGPPCSCQAVERPVDFILSMPGNRKPFDAPGIIAGVEESRTILAVDSRRPYELEETRETQE